MAPTEIDADLQKYHKGDRIIWKSGPSGQHGTVVIADISDARQGNLGFADKYQYAVKLDDGNYRLLGESVLKLETKAKYCQHCGHKLDDC